MTSLNLSEFHWQYQGNNKMALVTQMCVCMDVYLFTNIEVGVFCVYLDLTLSLSSLNGYFTDYMCSTI